jgi:hypothetical protein
MEQVARLPLSPASSALTIKRETVARDDDRD